MHAFAVRASPPSPPKTGFAAAEKCVPLTPAQQELWLVNKRSDEASSAGTESATLQLTGPLDVEALRRTLQDLIARHDVLRTTFGPAGDVQMIADRSAVTLSFHDCSRWVAPPARHNGTEGKFPPPWATAVIRESLRPFDLAVGPLFRPVLVRTEPEKHILTLIAHPIICDQWSLGILLREWGHLYAADIGNRSAALDPAPSFSHYVGRQLVARQDAPFARAEQYWRQCFADGGPNLDLPADRPRPARRSYIGDFASRTLSPDFSLEVQHFCAQGDRNASTTLLAAFIALVHRVTGENDVVVGMPIALQAFDGQPNLVGPLACLLPIRSRITGDELFSAYLALVQRNVADACEHARYFFPGSPEPANLPRDGSHLPRVAVLFSSTDSMGALAFGGLGATFLRAAKRCVNFDLHFSANFVGESVTLECDYSTELFDRTTVNRWLGHFETLLRAVIAQPESILARLPLLTAAELEQIVVRWNETEKQYDREQVIARLFEAQVARTPEATALVAGDEHITYRELDARSSHLAQRLRGANVGADMLVGVFTTRTPQLLVAILGILKAGGAYVPLDPQYPAERLEFIVRDTGLRCLVSEQSLTTRLPAGVFDLILIDREDQDRIEPRAAPSSVATSSPTADHLAYVIYTSGSTGQPKGVAIIQRCVVALVAWARDWYRPEELDGVLFSTSASFDISVFEIFCPLCLGGKIVLADSLLHLPALPGRNEVRHLSGVPSAVAEIVRANAVPPSVTTITLAGEPLPGPLVDALHGLTHIRRVFELYGPTETTVYSTGAVRPANTPPSLGRPLPNERIYILDPHLQPVPIGVRGELYIGGDKLARGYLNRPDLTAERFIASPFIPGERLYRTGDFGRWNAEGMIESLGRSDHQVKVWGFRIELGEVESALARHPSVAEAAVIARPAPTGSNRLIAYAVVRHGAISDPRILRAWLQRHLPEYMLPSSIVIMDRLPRTANGKADRQRLARNPLERCAGAGAEPGRATERVVSEICCQVLGREGIGPHDNFFTMGGNLVLAFKLINRLRESIGVNLTWPQFFAAATIADLSAVIDRALQDEAAVPAGAASRGVATPSPAAQSSPVGAELSS